MPDAPVTVIGSNVSAYAAADAAARAGQPVRFYVPRHGDGAGFTPLRKGEAQLPLGFRVLELVVDPDHPRVAPPLEDYRPDVAGHRDYLGLLHQWFAELLGPQLRQLPAPQMWCNGRLVPDIFYTLDAADLPAALSGQALTTVARQAAEQAARHGAAGVLADPHDARLWELDLDTASRRNHGALFHDTFIRPMTQKIFGADATDVPTMVRRKAWMPLFWPETLHQVATGAAPAWRPTHRRFHDNGHLDPVSALRRRLQASPHVQWVDVDRVERVTVRGPFTEVCFVDGTVARHRQPLLGVQPEELFNAAGAPYRPERVTSVLTWLEVADEDVCRVPGVVMVVDPEIAAFRISAGGAPSRPGHQVFTVELAQDVADADIAVEAAHALRRLGLVTERAGLRSLASHKGLAFTAPTNANRRRFEAAKARFDELGSNAELLGGASTFGADSLNEQAIQGLAAAARALAAARPQAA